MCSEDMYVFASDGEEEEVDSLVGVYFFAGEMC